MTTAGSPTFEVAALARRSTHRPGGQHPSRCPRLPKTPSERAAPAQAAFTSGSERRSPWPLQPFDDPEHADRRTQADMSPVVGLEGYEVDRCGASGSNRLTLDQADHGVGEHGCFPIREHGGSEADVPHRPVPVEHGMPATAGFGRGLRSSARSRIDPLFVSSRPISTTRTPGECRPCAVPGSHRSQVRADPRV